ncbi:MAG: SRPBCC domain-containing protein [Micrococcaceae bacterium]|nr:SRPBCC domain-containing protein [Micrococcaceae bacterium]
MSKAFEIVEEVQINGTPERIWEAVTTGTAAWMFPTDQWPAVRVVDEYPTHLVTRMDGAEGWFNQVEHLLAPQGTGTAMRYVHSGIFVEDWNNQYDGASKHTVFYLHTLGQYLSYFDGKPVAFSDIQGPEASTAPEALDTWLSALGITNEMQGAELDLELPGFGTGPVIVDFRNENFVGLRTRHAMVRIFGRNAFGAPVGVSVHDFTPGADAQANTEVWQEAIEAAFRS